MNRLLILIALCLVIFSGCSSIFNADSAIEEAFASYTSADHPPAGDEFRMDDEKSVSRIESRAAINEFEEAIDEPNTTKNNFGFQQTPNNFSPKTGFGNPKPEKSSWDLIEQSVLHPGRSPSGYRDDFQELPLEVGLPTSNTSSQNETQLKLGSDVEDPNQKMIQIFDRSEDVPFSTGVNPSVNSEIAPLIQRPVISPVEISPISLADVFNENSADSERRKGINWRDSLEAAGDHLREELKSGQIGKEDAKQLSVLLEILDSIDGENRSVVNLVAKIKDLKAALPAHHFAALQKVISQTQSETSGSKSLDHLIREALEVVSDTANLEIKKAVLCKEVEGYGKFTRFESNVFEPGDEFLLYCEIENFSTSQSEELGQVVHQCEFKAQIQFLDENSESNFGQSLSSITDRSQSNRKDFYILFRIRIPDLDQGDHSIQVQIHDKIGRKTATLDSPIAFRIAK